MAQTILRIPDAPASSFKRSSDEIASPKYAARLYVASYDNSVTPFSLQLSDNAVALTAKPANKKAGPNPTWLDLQSRKRKLFCLNEQIDPSKGAASLTEYDIESDGSLKVAKKVDAAPGGPVQSKYLPLSVEKGVHVVAHYSPGTFTAFNQNLERISQINLAVGPPGPTQRQQEGKSNGHGVITHERLGTVVLVPDLSQDRVWVIDCSATSCSNVTAVTTPPGTGPRHGTIWEARVAEEGNTALYLFVVGEISNKIEGYKIDGAGPALRFRHVSTTSATQTELKEGYAAAEILTSPNGKHIVVSNRANKLSKVEECDANSQNCASRPSDTITTFRPRADGTLENVQAWSSGGAGPRAFDFNAKGDLIAVGLDRRLVILQRDPETGTLGQILTDAVIGDQVTSVVWDEVDQSQYLPLTADVKQEFLQLAS